MEFYFESAEMESRSLGAWPVPAAPQRTLNVITLLHLSLVGACARLDGPTLRSAEGCGDLGKLTVELARSRADAINVAERVRSEQRRRVDKVNDDKFDVQPHMFEVGDCILRSMPGHTAERLSVPNNHC
jgi:hypothetical protein